MPQKADEVVIFQYPSKKAPRKASQAHQHTNQQQSSQQADVSIRPPQQKMDVRPQKNIQEKLGKAASTNDQPQSKEVVEGQKLGTEVKEMEEQATQAQSPETLKKSGEQEGIKEAAKEAKKAQEASPNTYKELGKYEGMKEAQKEAEKSSQTTSGKLDKLVQQVQKPLLQLKTSGYLLLNIMPDILTIDPLKVTILYRSILGAEQEKSVFIKDIADASVQSIPFAASLYIVDNTDKDNPIIVKPFKKEDAERAKSLIMGLIAISKESIDLATLESSEDIEKKVESLGKTTT